MKRNRSLTGNKSPSSEADTLVRRSVASYASSDTRWKISTYAPIFLTNGTVPGPITSTCWMTTPREATGSDSPRQPTVSSLRPTSPPTYEHCSGSPGFRYPTWARWGARQSCTRSRRTSRPRGSPRNGLRKSGRPRARHDLQQTGRDCRQYCRGTVETSARTVSPCFPAQAGTDRRVATVHVNVIVVEPGCVVRKSYTDLGSRAQFFSLGTTKSNDWVGD